MFKLVAVFLLFSGALALPLDGLSILGNLDDYDGEYDVIIDQRQNGTNNFRIRLNGLNIALPAEEEEPARPGPASGANGPLAAFLDPTLLATALNENNNQAGGDLIDLAEFFDWKKKSEDNKKSSDTQSRTKDIPTESQLREDSKSKLRDMIRGEGRRYKLQVGEKYIIPILRFLKKATEDAAAE